MNNIFRNDEYGTKFYIQESNKKTVLNASEQGVSYKGLDLSFVKTTENDIMHFHIELKANEITTFDVVGLRLGVDCYMVSYPEWDDKFFPTALRCEQNGFWGCFCSPVRKMLGVASPSDIVSWKIEYNTTPGGDVGHRIYTASVEFVNVFKQPQRHIKKTSIKKGETISYDIYFKMVEDEKNLYEFVEKHSNIQVLMPTKFTLEKDETTLEYGRHIISTENQAQTSVYVRKDWFYYLDMARKNAEISQQKVGTHVESWYGFYTLVAYAKIINNDSYTRQLEERFERFLFNLAKKSFSGKLKMKKLALPERLQNVSGMLSLLADFYELTNNEKYLDYAKDFADWLMSLQDKDGSYRSHKTHYTCVIYPAKSMLELYFAEKKAGRLELAKTHYDSAYKAIMNLYELEDNIQTEGEMTFEDGMISCEALQLGFLALNLEGELKTKLTAVAEKILYKHKCLEQCFVPDCRTIGATLRFWEARYDINFQANMLNTPHGWTAWKIYATYYLYLLTGKLEYLLDTMNTLGSCMQLVDSNGNLNWSFVIDPYICGKEMVECNNKYGFEFKDVTVGEQYLSKLSHWYKHDEKKLTFQYIRYFDKKSSWKKDSGGSCDNDVHEIFKCLDETVLGKSFIHFQYEKAVTFNCYCKNGEFFTNDSLVSEIIVFAECEKEIYFNSKNYSLKSGVNMLKIK